MTLFSINLKKMKYTRFAAWALLTILTLQVLSLLNYISEDTPYVIVLVCVALCLLYDGFQTVNKDYRSIVSQTELSVHWDQTLKKEPSHWYWNRLTLRFFYIFIAEYLLFAVVYSQNTLRIEYRMQMMLFGIFLGAAFKMISSHYFGK
jgi:hypothetical protein